MVHGPKILRGNASIQVKVQAVAVAQVKLPANTLQAVFKAPVLRLGVRQGVRQAVPLLGVRLEAQLEARPEARLEVKQAQVAQVEQRQRRQVAALSLIISTWVAMQLKGIAPQHSRHRDGMALVLLPAMAGWARLVSAATKAHRYQVHRGKRTAI